MDADVDGVSKLKNTPSEFLSMAAFLASFEVDAEVVQTHACGSVFRCCE